MRPHIAEQVVSTQIERLSGLNFQWLRFPSALEARFEADTAQRRCRRLWLEGLLAIILYDCYLYADHLGTPREFSQAVLVRAGIITPLALLVNLSMLRRPHRIFREASISVVAVLAGFTHLYLGASKSPVATAYAQFGILAVILFANTLMRLRFPYALATSAIMFLGDIVFLRADTTLNRDQKIVGLCLVLCTILVTIIANYSSNREERLAYLLWLRGDTLVSDLNRSNEYLSRIAEIDALTGLANRHSFDRRFQELWQSTAAQHTPLSVILIDVDHFKHLNDKLGHLYGDQVLKSAAILVMEALRVKGDFAARFGGEEFVILLPNTSQSSAELVAERVRKLIEVAGLPPLEGLSRSELLSITFTVSCGVSTAYPAAGGNMQQLLDSADQALYAAKDAGRNRVCVQ